MARLVRIEIEGRDSFWSRAFHVEWEYRFPDRKLAASGERGFLVEPEWLSSLEQVAEQTFCRIVRAPDNPRRRQWLSALKALRGRE